MLVLVLKIGYSKLKLYRVVLKHLCTFVNFSACSPQVVNERLICHAIIGKNPLKERIMAVDVRATFVAPLLEFSAQLLHFKLHQVPCCYSKCGACLYTQS